MKSKVSGAESGSSYDVFEVGMYVAVKYQSGINLKMLLWLFWLDEKKTEVLRTIFKENAIMPVNGDLRLSNGGIIPVNTIIKVNKNYLSQAAIKKITSNPVDLPAVKSKNTADQKSSVPAKSANVWDQIYGRIQQVLNTKRKQYLAIAGGVLLVSSLGITTAVAVSQIIDPPKKSKKVEVAEVDRETPEETDPDTKTTSVVPVSEEEITPQKTENISEISPKTWEVSHEMQTSQNTPKTESKAPQSGMAKDGTFVFTSQTKAADLREILKQFNAAERSKKKK